MARPKISQLVAQEAAVDALAIEGAPAISSAPAPEALPALPALPLAAVDIDSGLLTGLETAQLQQQQARAEMDRLAQLADASASEHLERGEILIERVIDPHEGRLATVLSYWAPLTPSLCTERKCGYDAAMAVGFTEGWDSIPEGMPFDQTQSMRQFVGSILARHQSIKHPSSQPKHIRTAEEARTIRAKVAHPLPGGFVTNPRI